MRKLPTYIGGMASLITNNYKEAATCRRNSIYYCCHSQKMCYLRASQFGLSSPRTHIRKLPELFRGLFGLKRIDNEKAARGGKQHFIVVTHKVLLTHDK